MGQPCCDADIESAVIEVLAQEPFSLGHEDALKCLWVACLFGCACVLDIFAEPPFSLTKEDAATIDVKVIVLRSLLNKDSAVLKRLSRAPYLLSPEVK
eukprot:m51a1_g5229 hypothetical protein (98) ;mRNA; f:283292-285254